MKRKQFLLSLPATAVTLNLFANNTVMKERTDKGFVVEAGEARTHGHIQLKGVNSNILYVKTSGKDTDGGFALFEPSTFPASKNTFQPLLKN
jgi:hypothetical protein